VFGDRTRRPQARQHNVQIGDGEQYSGEDHRFRLGVRHEERAHHVPEAAPGGTVPRSRGVLPRKSGSRSGHVGPGMHHAGNRYRRQAVRRGRGGAVDQDDHTHATRARVLDVGFTKRYPRNETHRRLDSISGDCY